MAESFAERLDLTMHFDLDITKPNYSGGSIVNLMATIKAHFGKTDEQYPELESLPATKLAHAKRVILLVIDGLGADLLSTFAEHSPTQSLQQYQLARMTSVYPPTTAAAVTTFMSGQAPQQHGLTGWFMNFREIGATSAVLPFISRYGREPLSTGGVGIEQLVTCASFANELPLDSCLLLPNDIVDSDFSRHVGGRGRRLGFTGLDDFVAKLEEFLQPGHDAAYLYAYWSELDHLAHLHGPSDERVLAHFLELEQALLPVLSAAAARQCGLVITADHGFIDSGPSEVIALENHPKLADMLAMPLFGEPRSAYCIVRKGCDDEFEDYIARELSNYIDLVPSAELIAEAWFGTGEPHPELGARVGDYTLQMKHRYTIRDRLVSERPFDLYGMHGGITAAEQWVPLILSA